MTSNFPASNLYRGYRQISTGKFVDRLDGTGGDSFEGMSADADAIAEVAQAYSIDASDLEVVTTDTNPHLDAEIIASVVPWTDSEREKRNARLSQSDWTQLGGSPLNESQRSAWATYRQALRDMPETRPDLNQGAGLEWPVEPS